MIQVLKAQEAGTTPDITNHPWHITRKYGFGINVEQNLSPLPDRVRALRMGQRQDGVVRLYRSGSDLRRRRRSQRRWWHRKQDRAGIAFVTNAIKKDHQNYLAAGGLGFLLGDGKLNYGRENILESYYTAHVWRGIYVAPGLQYVVNPGYNRDRGPVVVPTFRAHVEF